MSDFLLKNHPSLESIEWKYLDKDTYQEIEGILTDGVVFFEPFLFDNFFPQQMFDELKSIVTNYDLSQIDYSNQMNKWEQNLPIPTKFLDYATRKLKYLLKTKDIQFGYTMYAHHQITSEGRVPKLPLHIDWAPGAYMIDLQIGGNRDWGFVAKYNNFICKPNQAVVCQPQFDYHYRPSWNSNNPGEYYQAIFFHMINRNHWSNIEGNTRSEYLNSKYSFGMSFRDSDIFKNFQLQRQATFEKLYIEKIKQLQLPPPPWNETPTEEDASIHSRKNVIPLLKGKDNERI